MVEWIVGGLGVGLFGYNRKNFMFDSEQKSRREFQGQNMRVKRFELYREDVRDLVELTVSKMDNYLIVGTLQMGFCVRFFCEGHPLRADLWPAWLVWLWAVANIGALLYFAMSMWLAMHASIAAHSFGVRMLTQFVRLPVAGSEELDAATAKAEDYEQARAQDMFRLPLLKQQLRRLNAAMANYTAAQPEEPPASGPGAGAGAEADAQEAGAEVPSFTERTVDLEHIVLYRQAQENWQAYDAYARVCMAMGTNQMLCALSFYCIGLLVVEVQAPVTALCCNAVLQVGALLVVMLDVYDWEGRSLLSTAAALIFSSGLLVWLGTVCWALDAPVLKPVVPFAVPLGFLLHGGWIAFVTRLAEPRQCGRVALPERFRAVLYLDVFGWLPGPRRPGGGGNEEPPRQLRDSLSRLCQRLHGELQQDMACWEGQDVAEQATAEHIEALRARLQASAAELKRVCPGLEELPRQDAPSAAQRTWLRFQLGTAGNTVDFFLRCGAGGEVRCTPPRDAYRILDLESFEHQLEMFKERVRALARFPQESPAQPDHGLPHPPRARSDSVSTTVTFGSSSPPLNVRRAGGDDGYGNPRGSVQLVDRSPVDGEGPNPPAAIEATFNPHGVGGSSESEESRRQRPPGHMPWRTFLHGSGVLLTIWLLGTMWCTILVLFGMSHIIDVVPSMRLRTTWRRDFALGLELVDAAPLRPPLSRPRGLACHPALGHTLLVAERYDVRELHLGPARERNHSERWRADVLACLEGYPEFMAGGIRATSLECGFPGQPGARCVLHLLGEGGRAVLPCPLRGAGSGDAPAVGPTAGLPVAPVLLTLHGGPWRALAAPPGGAVWALDDAGLVQMQPRWGALHELVPQFALPYTVPGGLAALRVLNGGLVLGLESSGWLHTWRGEGGSPVSWRLPAEVLWSGMCADGHNVYLLSTGAADGSVKIWRTGLPFDPRAV